MWNHNVMNNIKSTNQFQIHNINKEMIINTKILVTFFNRDRCRCRCQSCSDESIIGNEFNIPRNHNRFQFWMIKCMWFNSFQWWWWFKWNWWK
jgi:hypothetical protein